MADTILRPSSIPSGVPESCHPGMFGDFPEVVGSRIAELRASGNPGNAEKARFFDWLLTEVDTEQFRRMQERYFGPEFDATRTGAAKYVDPIVWFESKIAVARRIGLDKRPPLRILDIGTGPGHFPTVARFYGHEVTGLDLPPEDRGGLEDTPYLYEALCDLYGVRRIYHAIRSFETLPDLGGPYDLVTGLMAAFNVEFATFYGLTYFVPWSVEAWRFFLRDLRGSHLTPGGELFMGLAEPKITDVTWAYLTRLASFSTETARMVHITDFSRIG